MATSDQRPWNMECDPRISAGSKTEVIVTKQIGEEMAAEVGMDPIVAVALIQALMQIFMYGRACRNDPMAPEERMLRMANHHPKRLKNHVRRQGRKLKMSESEIDRAQEWIVPAIKRSNLKTRKALCEDAAVPA